MNKKNIAIAARIVFGILAVAAVVATVYYIVQNSLSDVLTSMTLCLLSIALALIYGRYEEAPEGVISPEEKELVKSHIGADAIVVDEGEWYFEGDDSRFVAVKNGEVVLSDGDRKYTISDITPTSFTLRDSSGRELHAHKK